MTAVASPILEEIEALTAQIAELESKPKGQPENEATKTSIMESLDKLLDRAHQEFVVPQDNSGTYSTKQLRRAFDTYDSDKSGFLEHSEIAALARALGADKEVVEIEKAIADMDTDRDGSVSFDEFANFFTKEQTSGKIAAKLRAKMLKGKFDKQMARFKTKVDSAMAPVVAEAKAAGSDVSSRALTATVEIGNVVADGAPLRADFHAEGVPHEERPVSTYDAIFCITLSLKPDASEDAIQECVSMMMTMYNQIDDPNLKSFSCERGPERTLVATLHLDPDEPVRMADKLVFLHGQGVSGFTLEGVASSNLEPDKLTVATEEEPYDIASKFAAAINVSARVTHNAWFDGIMKIIFAEREASKRTDEEDADAEIRPEWEMEMRGEWKPAVFKAPAVIVVGKKLEFKYEGIPVELEFTSSHTGVARAKGKEYPCRLNAAKKKEGRTDMITHLRMAVFPKVCQWLAGTKFSFKFASLTEAANALAANGGNRFALLKKFTVAGCRAKILSAMPGAPPKEMYENALAAIGGVQQATFELKCGHGDIKVTGNVQGLARIADLMPPWADFGEGSE